MRLTDLQELATAMLHFRVKTAAAILAVLALSMAPLNDPSLGHAREGKPRPKRSEDFVAQINTLHAEGVTAENNIVVPLLQAFGPEAINVKYRDAVYSALGVSPLPVDRTYLGKLDDVIRPIVADEIVRIRQAANDAEETPDQFELEERLRKELAVPWKAADHPRIAAWLRDQQQNLKHVAEAAGRSRCYLPVARPTVSPNRIVSDVFDRPVDISIVVASADALCARAMLHAGEGRMDDAWQDIVRSFRLGRTWAKSPTFVDMLIGQIICAKALNAINRLLEESPPTSEQAKRLLAEISMEAVLPDAAGPLTATERPSALAILAYTSKHGVSWTQRRHDAVEKYESTLWSRLEGYITRAMVDFDYAAELVSRKCDATIRACALPTRAERKRALKTLFPEDSDEHRLRGPRAETTRAIQSFSVLLFDWPSQRRIFADRVSDRVMQDTIGAAAILNEYGNREKFVLNGRLACVGLALAAYHHDHKAFPAKLDELVPEYLKSIPLDPFDEKPLRYRRIDKGYLLYSIAETEKDDKGLAYWDAARCEGEEPPRDADDIAFRVTSAP